MNDATATATATRSRVCLEYNAKAIAFMTQGHHVDAANALKIALLGLETEHDDGIPNQTGIGNHQTRAVTPPPPPLQHTTAPAAVPLGHLHQPLHAPPNFAYQYPPPPRPMATMGALTSVPLLTTEEANALSPDNLFTLYPRVFDISVQEGVEEINEARLMVVLLYNLAVLTHIRVLAAAERESSNLGRAFNQDGDKAMRHVRALYRNVMKCIYTTWSQEDADEMVLLLLAVACNAGHVNSHRTDFGATRESLGVLLRLVTLTTARLTIPTDDFAIFFDSVCIFLEGAVDLCIAPAA